MKKIESVSIWKNGQLLEANLLDATMQDNLINSCTFYYNLLSGGEGTEAMPLTYHETLVQGSLILSGEDYLAWDGSNDYAFTYIAEKLNLTLIA
jgi:hypothetical protein